MVADEAELEDLVVVVVVDNLTRLEEPHIFVAVAVAVVIGVVELSVRMDPPSGLWE